MAFDKRELRKACRTRLKTVSTLPTTIQWENRPFTPPDPSTVKLWVREKVFISSERKTTTGLIEAAGEVRYDVFIPAGGGTNDAEDLTKAIAEAFEAGNGIQATGFQISIERTERRNLIPESEYEGWSYLPVVSRWRVFTSTTA